MEKRTKLISIRVTPATKKALIAEAKEFGQKTLAGYCLGFLLLRRERVNRRREAIQKLSEF